MELDEFDDAVDGLAAGQPRTGTAREIVACRRGVPAAAQRSRGGS